MPHTNALSTEDYFYPGKFAPNASTPTAGDQSSAVQPFSNLIEVSVNKTTVVVQKGNVLEIVPTETNNENSAENSKDEEQINAQRQVAIQRQLRLKRKLERQQKRLAKEKRKEFLLSEIERLNEQMLVGSNGKIVKAGDLFANPSWREELLNTTDETANVKENKDDNNSQPQLAKTPALHAYDSQMIPEKSILSERNRSAERGGVECDSR